MEEEKRDIFSADLRAIRTEEGDGQIEGYSAVFNKYSEDLGGFREKIKPGAFAEALKTSDARALFNHDPNIVLGRQSAGTLELKEDKKGLFMRVKPPKTQRAEEIMASIQRGDITQQSFGFTIAEDSWRTSEKYGEVRTIEKIGRLFDVSPVTFPAYPDTKVALRSRDAWREFLDADPTIGDDDADDDDPTINAAVDSVDVEIGDEQSISLFRRIDKTFENYTED